MDSITDLPPRGASHPPDPAPLLALFEHAPLAMVVTDLQHRILAANPACCTLLGRTRSELEGLDEQALVHPEDRDRRQVPADPGQPGAPLAWTGELRYLARDGRVVRGRTRVAVVRAPDGRPSHHVSTIEDVTAAHEDALRQQRQAALLHMAGHVARLGGWVVDLARREVRWSDTVCEIHEMPRGTTPSVDDAVGFYAPESRPRIVALFEACVREGTPFDDELQLVTATGRRIWVRAIGQAVRDSQGQVVQVQGAFQDISDRKDAEHRARDLAERLTNTLESLTDAFFTLDPDWRFTYLNREAERLLLRARADLLGRDVWQEFPQAGSFEEHYRRAVREQQTVSFEEYYAPLDCWFEVKAYPSAEGLAVYFRDVTERRRAQEQLQRTLAQLRQRNRELQDFAFVASHDLQEPLRKIRTFCDRLLSRHAAELPDRVTDQLQRIDRAAQRMHSLIEALLDYTRVASRTEPFAPVDLAAVCAGVVDDLEAAIEAAGAQVEVGALPTLPGDAHQLRQLFQNLLSNALKFRDPQRPPHVRISAGPVDGGAQWRVLVQDNGIGFDSRHAGKIFSPFQRLHTRDAYEGTGIGLAIVQRIVERHAGRIEATAEPGQGAAFAVTLPARLGSGTLPPGPVPAASP